MSITQNALASADVMTVNSWKDAVTGKVEFPVTQSSDKWKEFNTHNEMISNCNVPDDLLGEMSTEELVDLVLKYPLLGDMLAYSSYQQGLEAIKSDFNGLSELFTRDDAGTVLLDIYCKETIVKKSHVNPDDRKALDNAVNADNISSAMNMIKSDSQLKSEIDEDMNDIINNTFLETILAQDNFINEFTDEQLETLSTEAEKKYLEKKNSKIYIGLESTFYDSMYNNGNLDKINSSEITSYASSFVTIYTPKGTAITALRSSNSFTSTQITALNSWVKNNYPNAEIIYDADDSYNCHSYAWYSQTINHVWVNSPEAYVTDGSYTRVGTSPTANGQRALWINAASTAYYEHSGYVSAYSTSKITSKWGQYPLVKHSASYSPYGGTIYYYK